MNGIESMEREDQVEMIRNNIQKQYPEHAWPEPVLEPIFHGRLKKKPIPTRFAVIDINNDNHFFDVVSDRYHLVTHEEVVHDLLSSVPTEFGDSEVSIKIYGGGARVRADVTFPNLPESIGQIKEGDKVNPRVSAYSSLDRSTYHGIITGAEQLVCANGLVSFVAGDMNKRKHIIGSTITPEQFTADVQTFLTEFSQTTDLWRTWANRQLEKTEFKEVMEALPFSEPEIEKILELPLMNNDNKFLKQLDKVTLWDVSSASTQFAKHVVRGEQRAINLEIQIAAVLHKV